MSTDAPSPAAPNNAALYEALAEAQGEFPPIERTRTVKVQTRTGGSYTFAYAPLDTILKATRPALKKYGLAITQPLEDGYVVTRLGHKSGAEIVSRWPVPEVGGMQELGSVIQYLRRYQVTAILGVASEEDDDANVADGNTVQSSTDRAPRAERSAPSPDATGGTKIVSVTTKTGTSKKNGKPWTRFDVAFEDGRLASTFDQQIAGMAERIAAAKVGVTPVIEEDGRNLRLVGLETDADVPHPTEVPFEYEGQEQKPSPAGVGAERSALMLKVRKLGTDLGLTDDQKKTVWGTYVGEATDQNADPAALQDLIKFLETRAGQKGVAA